MKLIVLAGAKKDAEVPLKKSKFIIGRAEGCSLRAGSNAISRRHCEIAHTASGAVIQDLGSRNGTIVNDVTIEGPTLLSNGDEIKIGPLEFRFEAEPQITKSKAPKVEGVADAVARATSKSGRISEEDVSDWLLGSPDEDTPTQAVKETQSFNVDDTRAIMKDLKEEEAAANLESEEKTDAEPEEVAEEQEESEDKKKPGKLPNFNASPKAKDSREAAAQVLRDMARRR